MYEVGYNIIMSKSKRGIIHWITKFEKPSCEKGMVGFLVKKGIAKGKKTANIELLLIALFFFAMSPLMFVII